MAAKRPLAERIRPQNLEAFVGQKHLNQRIQAMIQDSQAPPSLLLFGPPGSGKSTLALLIAKASKMRYERFSAPEAGLSFLRKKVSSLDILILDELHRFSKSQQDFFLPLLESGDLILLATTTENPSFNVTKQLLSRLHVLRLRPLNYQEMLSLAQKGLKELDYDLPEESQEILIRLSHGDARTLLNLLEYIQVLPPESRDPGRLKEALPEIIERGDKDGDKHYELISALIKSIRGSDPDAALYYLAGMLESGEDPRFICRRLILSASEDVGLADPQALNMAVSCAQAVEMIGMPEGFIPLSETVIYLSLSPKSNSAYAAYLAARQEIRKNGLKPVPLHLRNASTTLQKEWGYGHGYKYPHIFPGAWVKQEYLPQNLQNSSFYQAKDQGQENRLNLWLKSKWKEHYAKKSGKE